jgi:hypothetical protein
MIGLASLRYIVREEPLGIGDSPATELGWVPRRELVHDNGAGGRNLYIYENTFAMPRTYLAGSYLVVHNEEESLLAIKDHILDLSRLVVLEDAEPSFPSPETATETGLARISAYGIHKVRIEVQALKPAILVLTDSFYPGWVALVDGRETPIWRANSLFRAVEVGPGDHTVIFSYRPATFRWGAAITLGMLVLVVIGLLVEYKKNLRPRRLFASKTN